MDIKDFKNIGGLNYYVNPLAKNDGELIRALNVTSDFYGAKTKRPGYSTYLGTPDASQVNSLFSWRKNDGTTFYTYRASGSSLYYSTQGTGAWTICGNGTVGNGSNIGYAVLNDTLFIADGVGTLKYSTSGTSFTAGSLAPIAVDVEQYQGRIYAAGTASTLFYSSAGDGTNWQTSGTSDSSSLTIPGEGKINKVFKSFDRLIAMKNSGLMYRWDGYNLVDTATRLGASSPYSIAQAEGYRFWLNRLGVFGYGGDKPQLISNPIQRQIYNNAGSGIVGAIFDTAPGEVYRYDYLLAVGTITDDFTAETIGNAIIKYDFNKNEFVNWKFANFPTAFHSYRDASGNQQLIWGDATGQCYQLAGTANTDNGASIEATMEFVVHAGVPELDKKWNWAWFFFNPGCQAKVQVAFSDIYTMSRLKWVELGDTSTGVLRTRFPSEARSKFLFVRIYESSRNSRFTFYGMSFDSEVQPL